MIRNLKIAFLASLILIFFQNCSKELSTEDIQSPAVPTTSLSGAELWTKEKANQWYQSQKWLVGSDYIPATAINQLEMWQAATFDTATIEKEFLLAQNLGMNTMRVYLHDQLHQQDSTGFYNRINTFLKIAARHGIRPMFVLFDSCWDPYPSPGTQRAPKPFVHNSGWVQSPGRIALQDSLQYPRLERYVKGVMSHFNNDSRILAWDIWNEPDNTTVSAYGNVDLPNKVNYVMPLLKQAFVWARSVNPVQPLTAALWTGDWSSDATLRPIEKIQVEQSDFITFHNYANPADLEKHIQILQRFGRPIMCTEYMARPTGSTFEGCLPIGKKYNVGMYNWGFVNGKTQTNFPWDSWNKQYTSEPPLWFHDIFRNDGTPYNPAETAFIKNIIKS